MVPKSSYFSGYCVYFLLLQIMTSTSEKLVVTVKDLVARVGGQADLSCQLFPPRSAEHMEVRWFRGDHSQTVHLYRDGHAVNGEAAPEYVNRTEFVKEAMGEGKATLRIHNISISDDGLYQCAFKGSGFSDVASMNLSVAAIGLGMQIHVQVPGTAGLLVECHSGGWFPQPQMEWRDSRGEELPHSSKSYSQDGAGLFHMKMTLLHINQSEDNIICYVCNPLTGEEKQRSIILAQSLFAPDYIRVVIFLSVPCISLVVLVVYLCIRSLMRKGFICVIMTQLEALINPMISQFVDCLTCCIALLVVYVPFRKRVYISDPLFSLYNVWIIDIIIVISSLAVFFSLLICGLLRSLKAKVHPVSEKKTNSGRWEVQDSGARVFRIMRTQFYTGGHFSLYPYWKEIQTSSTGPL